MKFLPDKALVLRQLQRPIFWFIVAFFILGFVRNASFTGYQSVSIGTDGRGYYAYLPAYFLYHDNTFQKTLKAEMEYMQQEVPSQYYLFKDPKGRYYNKYFPGVAIFQAPFFGMAVLTNYVAGKDPTGYSHTFSNFFYLGHLFYSILGILIFVSCLRELFPNARNIEWKVILIYLATPLLYYSVEIPLSHSYTFLLFGVFTWLVLRIKRSPDLKYFFLAGLILGWITIVRPPNFMVVLIIPFLMGSWEATKTLFQQLFTAQARRFLLVMLGFLLPLGYLLAVLHWQTGEWFFWPYSGEGFNWSKPMFWQQLVSFRTGIFLQTPLVLFALIGAVLLVKKKGFAMSFWFLYLLVNAYVIAAWWCWDYASLMGTRPYTEHFFFIMMPLIPLMDRKPKLMYPIVMATAILGVIRYAEISSGYMTDQRFTKGNYFQSLLFWKPENFGRWSFTQSCEPFGEVVDAKSLGEHPEELHITGDMEFIYTSDIEMGYDHLDERIFVTVEMDKRVNDELPLEDVFVIIDAYDSKGDIRFYFSQPLYNDKYEAKGYWKHINVSEFVQDNFSQCDRVRVYIWNKGKRDLSIRNFKASYRKFRG